MSKIKELKIDYKTSLEAQLEKLGIRNYLDLSKIQNFHPQEEIIYDVEDGEEMKGKSAKDCEKVFKSQNRRGLNVCEVLAIIRENPKVLENHYIDCGGSRYEGLDRVPDVYLDFGGRPRLSWFYVDLSHPRWGAASTIIQNNQECTISSTQITRAARNVWEKEHGEVEKGKEVCHKCDNPACINLEHLFLGTHQENMQDMVNKKRNKPMKGELNGNSKLAEKQIKELISLKGKQNISELARKYGIDRKTTRDILKGKLWNHINLELLEARVLELENFKEKIERVLKI